MWEIERRERASERAKPERDTYVQRTRSLDADLLFKVVGRRRRPFEMIAQLGGNWREGRKRASGGNPHAVERRSAKWHTNVFFSIQG